MRVRDTEILIGSHVGHARMSSAGLCSFFSLSVNMTQKNNSEYINSSFSFNYFERHDDSKSDYLELLLSVYTFVVSWAFMAGAASQAGDADSSRAPGLTSGSQGSMNVHHGALLLVPQWQCISSIVFYIFSCLTCNTIRDARKFCRFKLPNCMSWAYANYAKINN